MPIERVSLPTTAGSGTELFRSIIYLPITSINLLGSLLIPITNTMARSSMIAILAMALFAVASAADSCTYPVSYAMVRTISWV